eukprot:COSAG01_NODE_6733_length_3524_cov_2.038832_6_plen_206_part_00
MRTTPPAAGVAALIRQHAGHFLAGTSAMPPSQHRSKLSLPSRTSPSCVLHSNRGARAPPLACQPRMCAVLTYHNQPASCNVWRVDANTYRRRLAQQRSFSSWPVMACGTCCRLRRQCVTGSFVLHSAPDNASVLAAAVLGRAWIFHGGVLLLLLRRWILFAPAFRARYTRSDPEWACRPWVTAMDRDSGMIFSLCARARVCACAG